jgi:hypothetical protein
MAELSERDLESLREAKRRLENPSLAAKLSHTLGAPLEKGMSRLPAKWSSSIAEVTRKSLEGALRVALATIDKGDKGEKKHGEQPPPALRQHQWLVAATGAAGGAVGLPALAFELPLSTIVMLRSIGDIARSEGEDLDHPETKLACLEVFALGGHSLADDSADTGYFAVRGALSKAVQEAAKHVAEKGIAGKGAPALVRLIAQIATRFEFVVSEKAVAQLVPVVGAAGGAIVNLLFIDHYQDVARGHFTVRRLEREYSADVVSQLYAKL